MIMFLSFSAVYLFDDSKRGSGSVSFNLQEGFSAASKL